MTIVRVRAVNSLGESPWSEYASVTTLIDSQQIPRVRALLYDNNTNTLTFTVSPYQLPLLARVPGSLWSGSLEINTQHQGTKCMAGNKCF